MQVSNNNFHEKNKLINQQLKGKKKWFQHIFFSRNKSLFFQQN